MNKEKFELCVLRLLPVMQRFDDCAGDEAEVVALLDEYISGLRDLRDALTGSEEEKARR